jgi:hypothetical protein
MGCVMSQIAGYINFCPGRLRGGTVSAYCTALACVGCTSSPHATIETPDRLDPSSKWHLTRHTWAWARLNASGWCGGQDAPDEGDVILAMHEM